jgi:hypothetical protein
MPVLKIMRLIMHHSTTIATKWPSIDGQSIDGRETVNYLNVSQTEDS